MEEMMQWETTEMVKATLSHRNGEGHQYERAMKNLLLMRPLV
jgi:hypothetical protein